MNSNVVSSVYEIAFSKLFSLLTFTLFVVTCIFVTLYFITVVSGNVKRNIKTDSGSTITVTDIDNSYFGHLTARNLRYNIQIFTFLTIACGIISLTRYMPAFLNIITGNLNIGGY